MSQNPPFVFGAAGGRVPPVPPHRNNDASHDMQGHVIPPPAHEAAFQPNAQLAAMDMSVLEGISPEKLAAIARLFQSGALQMPPPPPPPQPSAQGSVAAQPAMQALPLESQHPNEAMSASAQQDIDMDTEEGEVDESEEVYALPKARDFLRPPPTGPKNRSVSPRRPLPDSKPPKPVQSITQTVQSPSQPTPTSQTVQKSNGRRTANNDDAAKMFIREVIKAGYTFQDIASEVGNSKALVRVFKELGLPIPSQQSPSHSAMVNGRAASHAQDNEASAETAPTNETRKVSITKRAAPAKPGPVDRSEYLARLQAAKNKKPEIAAAPNAQPTVQSAAVVQNSEPRHASAADGVTDSSSRRLTAERVTNLTELARQKLEVLKAQRAAKQDSNIVSSPARHEQSTSIHGPLDTIPVQGGLGAGLADIASKAAPQAATPPIQTASTSSGAQPREPVQTNVSPKPAPPSRSFSGLPGLFMVDSSSPNAVPATLQSAAAASQPSLQSKGSWNFGPTHASTIQGHPQTFMATSTGSPASVNVPRKRPVAADFDDVSSKPNASKRPFGQSRNASEDESIVIQISDDEDDDNEEGMDTEKVGAEHSKTPLQTRSFRDIAPLRDFPPRSNTQRQGSGLNTPSGATYEQRLKEIEEMKLKIARMEKRQKVNGESPATRLEDAFAYNDTHGQSAPVHASSNTGTVDEQNVMNAENQTSDNKPSSLGGNPHSFPKTNATDDTGVVPSERAPSSTLLKKQQEKERLRTRLLELEQQEELRHIKEQFQPIVQDSEPLMSGALPDTSVEAGEIPINDDEEMLPVETTGGSPSEEGELSDDDSVSKFYSCQDAQGVSDDLAGEMAVGSQIRSQATTESATSDSQSNGSSTDPALAVESQLQTKLDEDGGRSELSTTLHGDTMTANESQWLQPHVNDEEMDEVVHSSGSMSEDDNDDDTEDDDDLDVIEEPASNVDFIDAAIDDENMRDTFSTRSPSSDPKEDFEPESMAVETDLGSEEDFEPEPISEETDLLVDHDDANDDLALELQPSEGDHTAVPDQDIVKPRSHFTPYQSPLMGFKDFRYHPDYTQLTGGFKSTTYSHNIDSETALCPFETAGGKCNDSTCQYQHFKSMLLSDSDLLKEMATKGVPVQGADEQKRWNEGLSALVRQLKTTNLAKDADAIAARIAEFRREFVGDPTRILTLW